MPSVQRRKLRLRKSSAQTSRSAVYIIPKHMIFPTCPSLPFLKEKWEMGPIQALPPAKSEFYKVDCHILLASAGGT